MGFMSILSLCTVLVLACVVHSQRWGFYGGYSWYGGRWGCNGYWYNPVCPDRSNSPNNCANTLTCPTVNGLAYSCISPGICCPTATATSVCPTGLFSGARCPFGVCPNGLQCFNGLCCLGTVSATCPDGTAGVGTCFLLGGILSCGSGFTCRAVGGQNLCCFGTNTASVVNTAGCVPRGGGCTSITQCNNGQDGYRCFDGRCCQLPSGARVLSPNIEKVCSKGHDPLGPCNVTSTTCPGGTCTKHGFCCPE